MVENLFPVFSFLFTYLFIFLFNPEDQYSESVAEASRCNTVQTVMNLSGHSGVRWPLVGES